MRFHKYTEVYGRLIVITPWIRHILPNWTGFTTIKESSEYIYNFVSKIVDAELRAFQDDLEDGMGSASASTNFIYIYAEQMQIAKRDLIANPSYHCEWTSPRPSD